MSESTEMYLETILVIQKKKGHVRSIDIAREMNLSKPTISQQMKRLKEKELINFLIKVQENFCRHYFSTCCI